MIWVIPVAGKGTRTKALGEFKPFIEINGRKIIDWFIFSIRHLIKPNDRLILITTIHFAKEYKFEEEIKRIFQYYKISNKTKIITCKKTPKGTSATILMAKPQINKNKPVIIINPDQFVDFSMPRIVKNSAFLGIYYYLGEKSGFVEIKNGLVIKFVEKRNISNLASAGIYIVSSGRKLISAIERQIKDDQALSGEFYIGPAFNYLIKDGVRVYPIPVMAKYDLGDPKSINHFSGRSSIFAK